MAQGFYELLGVECDAPPNQIREAYQRRLAELVRRLRVARQQGADVSILEAQERAVREAMEVLADAVRRRRYDAYLQVMRAPEFPEDAEKLWEQARGGMVDPVAGIALAAVRSLTRLPVGDPLPEPPPGYSQKRAWTVDLAEPVPAATPPAAPAPASVSSPDSPARTTVTPVQIHDDIEIVRMPAPSIAVGLEPAGGPPRPPSPELDFDVEAAPTDARIGIQLPPLAGRSDPDALDGGAAAPRLGLLGRLAALAGGSASPTPAPAAVDDSDDPWADDRGIFDLDQGPQVAEPADPIDRLIRQHGKGAALLRAVREHRGLSLEELARTTRISGRYLAALEEGAFDRLPSATFVRGYLRQVAQVLELGDRGVVEGYMALFTNQRG
jgi:hypothetical protein